MAVRSVINVGSRLTLARREIAMSTPADLKDLYADKLTDLWSANDQMQRL